MNLSCFKAYDIRGLYPNQLNEEIAEAIGHAFVHFLKARKVVVGRDMRPHSLPLFQALAKGMTVMLPIPNDRSRSLASLEVIDPTEKRKRTKKGKRKPKYEKISQKRRESAREKPKKG